jgi:hypothetical protein
VLANCRHVRIDVCVLLDAEEIRHCHCLAVHFEADKIVLVKYYIEI